MKRAFSLALLLLVALTSAPSFAQQRPGGERPGGGRPQPGGPTRQAQPNPPPPRPDWNNRQAPQPGRMSEEDRRQLRRDISDHGRDIYRERPAQKR